jgi:hypothetical protein
VADAALEISNWEPPLIAGLRTIMRSHSGLPGRRLGGDLTAFGVAATEVRSATSNAATLLLRPSDRASHGGTDGEGGETAAQHFSPARRALDAKAKSRLYQPKQNLYVGQSMRLRRWCAGTIRCAECCR